MGLGPHGCSLLQRIAATPPMWMNPFAMQMEGIARGEARREKAIWHAQRHASPRKPEAPVAALPKCKGEARLWLWEGESIESKGLHKECHYTAEALRKAGFKLPKIGGKTK